MISIMESLKKVSMPLVGQASFLLGVGIIAIGMHLCVNALSRASLISTEEYTMFAKKAYCVNALSRASLISTKIEEVLQ